MKKSLFFAVLTALLSVALIRCRKEPTINGTGIAFSNDTLTFDTVFTTLGSTTQFFKVYNRTGKDITISNVKLLGTQGSQFRINVDGISGTNFNDVFVPARDSIYVFVEVTVNPNDNTSPFVINDKVQFTVRNETANVVLNAWGQNAHYHLGETISSAVTWQNDKPHIIMARGGIGLAIDQNATLSIPSGARIFMGPNALISLDGTLDAQAVNGDSITFCAIRHSDPDYTNQPGQWLGIIFSRTATVTMKGCIVNESVLGVSDEHAINVLVGTSITTSHLPYTSDPMPTVTLDKTIIRNTAGTAVTAIKTNLTATNCLFHTAGGNVVGIFLGGTCNFTNCTITDIFVPNSTHTSPTLVVSDRIVDLDNTLYTNNSLTANFVNCVAYGTMENEVVFAATNPSQQINFKNCLVEMDADSFAVVTSANCILNENPQFKDPVSQNYAPNSGSPLIDSGISISGITPADDLYGHARNGTPDIGAIEAE